MINVHLIKRGERVSYLCLSGPLSESTSLSQLPSPLYHSRHYLAVPSQWQLTTHSHHSLATQSTVSLSQWPSQLFLHVPSLSARGKVNPRDLLLTLWLTHIFSLMLFLSRSPSLSPSLTLSPSLSLPRHLSHPLAISRTRSLSHIRTSSPCLSLSHTHTQTYIVTLLLPRSPCPPPLYTPTPTLEKSGLSEMALRQSAIASSCLCVSWGKKGGEGGVGVSE